MLGIGRNQYIDLMNASKSSRGVAVSIFISFYVTTSDYSYICNGVVAGLNSTGAISSSLTFIGSYC